MTNSLGHTYLQSVLKRMLSYKDLGDKTFAQLQEQDFYYQPSPESNSIAVIITHLHGNMLSRWTHFLTEDGEKVWRKRDAEFISQPLNKVQLLDLWEKGWTCLIEALKFLGEKDLLRTVTIRKEPLSVIDAINRQLAHYPHHVGQIVYIGKLIRDKDWQSLSIPKNRSEEYNASLEGKNRN